MTPGERFMKTISFEQADRVPIMDFGYWGETINRWHHEGMPLDIDTTEKVEAYFGLDRGFETNLVNYWGDDGPVGILWGIYPEFSKVVIEETEDRITYGGECGHIIESKTGETIPHQTQWPVETMVDFETKVLTRMDPWDNGRILPGFEKMLSRSKNQQQAVGVWIDGYLAWPRILMGIERLAYTYYDDPDLIHAIQRHHTDFVKNFVDMVLKKTSLSYACFFEDMAYNHGSLVSPDIFHAFMTPYYLELVDHLRARGIQKILIDSDGNTVKLSDLLVEVGADGHYPCEINSGSYPEVLRSRHQHLALIGGIDKRALAVDKEAIDRELERITPLLREGGYIPALDHRVHPQVSMENYRYYVQRKTELIYKYSIG